MNQMTKRAARATMRPALLGVEEALRQRTAYGFADALLRCGSLKLSCC